MTKTEATVKARLEADGWRAYKHGFPDFMAFKDGVLRFIEVKSVGDTLREGQAEVLKELTGCGFSCQVVYPEISSGEPKDYRYDAEAKEKRVRLLARDRKRRYRAKRAQRLKEN